VKREVSEIIPAINIKNHRKSIILAFCKSSKLK
jgi:hypothetical protein